MDSLFSRVESRAQNALEKSFGEKLDPVLRWTHSSKSQQFGDLQINAPMALAKQRGENPHELAQRIVDHLDLNELSDRPVEIAGPGFINIKLSDDALCKYARLLANDERGGVNRPEKRQNVVVDYGGANIAKEMHVGHLRSTIIGDSLVRTLEYLGHQITRQDHLGDWGTQFGMLVEYLTVDGKIPDELPRLSDLNEFYKQAKMRFDQDQDFASRSRARVARLQGGDSESLRAWRHIYDQTILHVSEMYRRLDVLMTPEDARGESFYNDMLGDVCDELVRLGVAKESDGALVIYTQGELNQDGSPFGLIIRKSDGGYGYATTDLAALKYAAQVDLADRVIYVVDARQSQHFRMVFDAAKRAGWINNTVPEHVQFGTILGADNKPFKTREGGTVKLGSLLDEALERANSLIDSRTLSLSDSEREKLAHSLGIGSVKYADLSSKRQNNYVFSWDRMLAMEGNTAPYMQYAIARINSLAAKANGIDLTLTDTDTFTISTRQEAELIKQLSRFNETLEHVERTLEPHHLCTYLFELAHDFTLFYENCPILRNDDTQSRKTRLALANMTSRTLKTGLDLLGIESPERL